MKKIALLVILVVTNQITFAQTENQIIQEDFESIVSFTQKNQIEKL